MATITKQQRIEQLQRELTQANRTANDLRDTLRHVHHKLQAGKVEEAMKLCLDLQPHKVEVWAYPENGRSYIAGCHIFAARGAAERYAEDVEESAKDDEEGCNAMVSKARPGDREFA